MKIGELEKAVREAIQANPWQPNRVLLAGYGLAGVSLPQEFDHAAKTLASRSPRASAGRSLLHAVQASWF